MKKIVVLTGAGISAESGLATFRDCDGLWENYSVYEVATPEAWQKDPALVLEFYNQRRKDIRDTRPNPAHLALAELEKEYSVNIITQNIDDLHERAGSSHVMHLHGQINQARSSIDPQLLYPIKHWQMKMGEKCTKGSQLRPNIVWFGEEVPMMEAAVPVVMQADIFIVIGTSLQVYPAASLVNFVPTKANKYHIDPKGLSTGQAQDFTVIKEKAVKGIRTLIDQYLKQLD